MFRTNADLAWFHPREALVQVLDYVSAGSVKEVVDLLSSHNGRARILCGGTDLLVQLRENRRRTKILIDVKKIPRLKAIQYAPQTGLWLGAAASCYAISHHRDVLENYPGLVDAICLIGGVQIQYRASVGGNLCNASPAADSIPALIVHEATCVIVSSSGTRELPVEQFCIAPGKNLLEHGEFLLAVKVPPVRENFGAHYLRFIPRNEMDIAVVGAGASITLDGPKHKLVLARIAQAAARPISDLRGTEEYRKHLCAVLTRRALEQAIERARAS